MSVKVTHLVRREVREGFTRDHNTVGLTIGELRRFLANCDNAGISDKAIPLIDVCSYRQIGGIEVKEETSP